MIDEIKIINKEVFKEVNVEMPTPKPEVIDPTIANVHFNNQGMYIGANTYEQAPFKVSRNGEIIGLPVTPNEVTASSLFTAMANLIYPVGCIYTTIDETNPGDIFGGTWVEFGSGRVLVGKSADTEFDTVEETGGAKTVTLDTTMIPSHLHTVNPPNTVTDAQGSHQHTAGRKEMAVGTGTNWTGVRPDGYSSDGTINNGASAGSHQHNLDIAEFNSGNTGGGSAHSNIQPYVVVFFWKRTL